VVPLFEAELPYEVGARTIAVADAVVKINRRHPGMECRPVYQQAIALIGRQIDSGDGTSARR
jgi:hypothetical protein